MTRVVSSTSSETADVDNALENAAGVLAAAGHEITDPHVEELVKRAAHGEISVPELLEQVTAHVGNQ